MVKEYKLTYEAYSLPTNEPAVLDGIKSENDFRITPTQLFMSDMCSGNKD